VSRIPAECFPPAEFVLEEMESRGWTREELMGMTFWTSVTLDALLVQREPLTEAQAADLERVFGISQRFWLNLETAYRRWKHAKTRQRHAEKLADRARSAEDG
jgi:plasmid maintenance system antidote protein VapI